ncbi:hypothetical protein BX666DRAFT_1278893 [Dichotomocladium elegans]|nr:hypothetical protein BX666DRAFT_1278893 [Dichotomocladium elegans]
MSSLTSLGVNKNSTRFAPKVKARQARRPPPSTKQASPAAAPAASASAAPVAENSHNVISSSSSSGGNRVDLPLSTAATIEEQQQQRTSVDIASLLNPVTTPSSQDALNTTIPSSPSVDKTPFDMPAVMTPGRPVHTPTPFDVSSPTFIDTPSPFMTVDTPRRLSTDTDDMRPAPSPQPILTPESTSNAQSSTIPTTQATTPAPQKKQSERSKAKRPRPVTRPGGAAPIVTPSRRGTGPPAVGSSSSSASVAIAITVGEGSTRPEEAGSSSGGGGGGGGGRSSNTINSDNDDAEEEEQGGRRRKGKRARKQQQQRKLRHSEIDPSEWKTLDDIQEDPAPLSYMDKPMSYFLRDLQTGIVSKAFKEREIEEQQLRKRMESEAISKEEVDRLAALKREAEEQKRLAAEARRIEEERRKEQESNVLRETSHAPQVRLINGQIVLDTDSLVLERANEDQAIDTSTFEVVEENNMTRRVNSRTFSNQVYSSRWSKLETEAFYDVSWIRRKAIAQCGTDFTMAAHLLPGRTRNQVRLKFNREEKINPDRVKDVLVRKRKPVDIDQVQKAIGKELEALPDGFHGGSNDDPQ